jgi:hypothetical protein
MALTGQIVNDVEATRLGDCLLKPPSDGYYRQPLDDADPAMDRNLQGTFLYHDARNTKFRYTASVRGKDKSFHQVGKKTRREQMHLNQALTLLVYIHQLDLCSLMKGDGMVISLA